MRSRNATSPQSNRLNRAITVIARQVWPPGNQLHALGAGLRGFHAVRVNDQYRIVFRFEDGDAFDVQCTDYH